MKNTAALLLFCCLLGLQGTAKEGSYAVSTIPEALLKNAHAVVRYADAKYTISGPGQYTVVKKIAITVLDEKGVADADLMEFYGKSQSITDISGALYDKNGGLLKSVKKKEILDFAGFGSSFVDDYRVKRHSFNTHNYPYTTEYEVETVNNSTLNFAAWRPLPRYYCAAEEANITIEYPTAFPFRYRTFGLAEKPALTQTPKLNTLTLKLTNLQAITEGDDLSTNDKNHLPEMILAADTFVLFGEAGSMASWKDMGRFFYNLNNERDVLTPEMKKVVHQVADSCTCNLGKITVLYEYLQKNTRYVSIQLGIGGWQTFDAAFVCEKKYGDCKALSNFMKAMLKEAGITAYATLARAGRNDVVKMDDKFPCNVFNHVILCVPQGRDTIWLECTSHDLPVGYLSSFTADRDVLLNTPDGGVEVHTPIYGKETNTLTRKATLTIDDKDALTGTINATYRGSFWDAERQVIDMESGAKNRHLNTKYGFSSYKATNLNLNNFAKCGIPYLNEEISVEATAEVTRSGKNLILTCNMLTLPRLAAVRADTSTEAFQLYTGYVITDTVIIALNGTYTPNTPMKETTITHPFGSYQVNYSLPDGKTLMKTSTYTINAGIYTAEQFKSYKKMVSESSSSSRHKIMLLGS